jgi:hypothetical protein
MKVLFLSCVLVATLMGPVLAQQGGGGRGRGGGPPDEHFTADREAFHFLLSNHRQIQRQVTLREDGVETVTTSGNPAVAAQIQEHTAAMHRRLEEGRPIRRRDPLFDELFRHHAKIRMKVRKLEEGVQVVETSPDPYVVKLLHAHAEVVSGFVKRGFDEARRDHAIPARDAVSPTNRDTQLTSAQRDQLVRLSSEFDRLYFRALLSTKRGELAQSGEALARFREQAPVISREVMQVFGRQLSDSPRWASVHSVITQAEALLEQGQVEAAHEALEPIRDWLTEDRRQLELEYPVDRLHEFHAAMERVIEMALRADPQQVDSAFRARLGEQAIVAQAAWSRVEQTSFRVPYLLATPEQQAAFEQVLAAGQEALRRLHRALGDGDSHAVLESARAIKPPLIQAYQLLFGMGGAEGALEPAPQTTPLH